MLSKTFVVVVVEMRLRENGKGLERASQLFRPLLDRHVIGGAPSRMKRRIRTICPWRYTRQERRGRHLKEIVDDVGGSENRPMVGVLVTTSTQLSELCKDDENPETRSENIRH